MKTGLVIFLSIVALALAGLAGFAWFRGQTVASIVSLEPTPPRLTATLQGFERGSDIAYKIIPLGGEAVTGHETIGEKGALDLPVHTLDGRKDASLTYDFSIRNKDHSDPVEMTLIFSPETGNVSVLGEGFDNFEPLELGDDVHKIRTKADWAGVVRHKTQWDIGGEKPGSFKVALFGNDLAGVIGPSPSIINILYAPGGGTANPGGVNGYSNRWCETLLSGQVVPGTCYPPTLAPHKIQGVNASSPHMGKLSFYIMDNFVRAMIMMSHQLAATMTPRTFTIGPMLDAKQQLEVQRDIQVLTAEAHKDYHPSDQMCRFGSFVKSVPLAEERVALNKESMNAILMGAYRNLANRSSSEGYALDMEARIRQFRRVYCDPRDNNDGLAFMCEHDQDRNLANSTPGSAVPRGIGAVTPTATSNSRKNKDIDFTRTADFPLTLNLDFTDGASTDDEEDIMALARNLYWPAALESGPWLQTGTKRAQRYMDARAMFAMQNVAHNSFIQIAAMKSRTAPGLEELSGWNFMKAMMREFGLNDTEIDKYMGEYPSYYAQMEVLTKKIYQSPDFYTNLYDKPVNVKRIYATLDAIRVMQQRDQLESRLRQEMLNSMLVEEGLARNVAQLNAGMTTDIGRANP